MRFRLLGPLEIEDVADEALLRRAKPRALLAMLLLNANRPVSTDRLVAGLWGDEEPATALGALQNYVSQLRKALGKEVVVTGRPDIWRWSGRASLTSRSSSASSPRRRRPTSRDARRASARRSRSGAAPRWLI